MFSPPDYVPLSNLLRYLVPLDEREVIRAGMEKMFTDSTDDGATRMLRLMTPEDFVESTFFDAIGHDCFMCSPTGTVMRLDLTWVKEQSGFFEISITDIERVQSEKPDLPKVPEGFYEAFMLNTLPHSDLVSEAERLNVTVLEAAKETGFVYYHMTLPLWFERCFFTISLRGFDYVQQLDFVETMDFVGLAERLRPFEGWSLCVTRQFADTVWKKRILAEAERIGSSDADAPEKGGRPATIRKDTRLAYDRLFPKGHNGRSWLQVLHEVNAITGHKASVDTLKRAVAGRTSTA